MIYQFSIIICAFFFKTHNNSVVSFNSAQVFSSYGLEPSDSSKLSTYSSLMRYLFVSPFWPFKPFWPFMPFWPFWTWSSFCNTSFSRHLSLAWVHFWTFLACRIQRFLKNLSLLLSLASHQSIWLWQTLNVKYGRNICRISEWAGFQVWKYLYLQKLAYGPWEASFFFPGANFKVKCPYLKPAAHAKIVFL